MTKEIHDVVSDSVSTERALDLALEALENNRRTHYYCEDTWYSCPKHEDGCANEAEGDECNCGADKANQEIDNAITAIKQARSAPYVASPRVQEPVAIVDEDGVIVVCNYKYKPGDKLYTTPPAAQRQWVGLTNDEVNEFAAGCHLGNSVQGAIYKAEAKLKEKNT